VERASHARHARKASSNRRGLASRIVEVQQVNGVSDKQPPQLQDLASGAE
jgi:hypothetical protein